MAIQLTVQLTDEQQTLMVQIARSVLGPDATAAEMKAWAQQVAADGLKAEVQRIGLADIDSDAIEAQNTARRTFVENVGVAWPEPVVEAPADPVV